MQTVRVLIVDDSGFVRNAISSILKAEQDFTVAGTAVNGRQAVEMAEELKPDIITMDVNMPEMDGIEALRRIMAKCPTRVLMLSSLTSEGAATTLDALALGAVDFLPKISGDSAFSLSGIRDEFLGKLRAISRKQTSPSSAAGLAISAETGLRLRPTVVAIGASTGGPMAVQQVISGLPKEFPSAGLIVQHMPPAFLEVFVKRLDSASGVIVKLAEEGETLEPGKFLLAPGNFHLKLKRSNRRGPVTVHLDPEPSDSLHRPSVDQMFLSVAAEYPALALGVIMTGMGQDGLEGARAMKTARCGMIAQDEASCVVYGMPRAVVAANLADSVLPLTRIQDFIIRSVSLPI